MEGYEELYDKIQSVVNKMGIFFGNAILNETPMDKHTKHLVERLQRISNELSDTAHELEEHLAWDYTTMQKRFTTRVRFIDGKTLPWHAYVTDNLTNCKFGSNHETEQQAREWVKWATQTCEKGRKTPDN